MELGGRDDDRADPRQERAQAVQQRLANPLGAADCAPVDDHPGLGDGEADEDADREERDEGVGIAAGEDQERGGDGRERKDPVTVDLPVGLQAEDMRQIVVAGQQLEQHRQTAERRVRGQRQQHHGGELHDIEGEIVPEGRVGELRQHGHALDRLQPEPGDQHGQTDQHHTQQRTESDLRALGAADGRGTEGRNGVGDRLHTGERRAARGEGLEQEQRTDRGGVADEYGGMKPAAASVLTGADRKRPTAISARIAPMNTAVGTTNARAESTIPRRFTAVIRTSTPRQSHSRSSYRPGKAEVSAATPAVTATATFRT